MDHSAVVTQISAKLRELAGNWIRGDLAFADPSRLNLAERIDPYTGQATLVGKWTPDEHGRRGEMTINDDGSFFAEYDVLIWYDGRFVEAVTAWGRPGVMKGEARLLEPSGEQVPG